MPISSAFDIAKQGLLATQRAVSVVSHNIANVDTPGYSRERANLEPVPQSLANAGIPVGGGVHVGSVDRLVDEYIQQQLNREHQQKAFDSHLEFGLNRLEGILSELSGSGISAALGEFFGALGDLSNDPGDPTVRRAVVAAATTLTGKIQDSYTRLQDLEEEANARVQNSIETINQLAGDIADLNGRILAGEASGNVAGSLRDQRDVLLLRLSEQIDFRTVEEGDGKLSVFLNSGLPLVMDVSAARLRADTSQPVPLARPDFFHVYFEQNSGVLMGPITDTIQGGEVGGSLHLRDQRVPSYRAQLDAFAFTLADRVNAVHLAGVGLDDAGSRNFFVDGFGTGPNPPGDPLGAVDGSALRISVNPDIAANVRHLAAGLPGPGPAAPGDNRNALALAAVERDGTSAFYALGDAPGAPTGTASTLGRFLDGISGRLGSEIESTRHVLEQQDLLIAHLEDRRGAVSGVSIDEEVTNLMALQRAYQANARVISTVDQMVQDLLDI